MVNYATIRLQRIARKSSLCSPAELGQRDGIKQWEKFLLAINLFYQASAVSYVKIGAGISYYFEWQISLHAGNAERWLIPHLKRLMPEIKKVRQQLGF